MALRLSAILAVLMVAAAFILTNLCLFAGSKQGFIESADLLTVNTSLFGQSFLNKTQSHEPKLPGNNPLSKLFNNVEGNLEQGANDVIGDIAQALNISDWYSAHILDYCRGSYTPGAVPNATDEHPSKNITQCSPRKAFFDFDPTALIQSELPSGINLTSDLDWPAAAQDGIKAANTASKAMFVLYCMSVAAAGLALITAILAIALQGRLWAVLNFLLSLLAFIVLLIASALATWIIDHLNSLINKYGNVLGVYAYKGHKFLGMTWAATALLFLVGFIWVYEFVVGHKRRNGGKRELEMEMVNGKQGRRRRFL